MDLTISLNTNRVTAIAMQATEHNSAGNMTKDDLRRYVYDGESRLVKLRDLSDTADVAEYQLDGAGIRVRKCVPNCTSPTSSTVYVYSGTKVIAEYDNGATPASPTREHIYSGSQMLAKIEGSSVEYQIFDLLSARVFTDTDGAKIREQGHYSFGGFWYAKDGAGNDVAPGQWFFTSYEREHEAGTPIAGDLDYAMHRSNYPRLGRFTSPDPVAGSILDPQSLNRYAYTHNDPVNRTDPLGLDVILISTDRGAGGGFPAGLSLPTFVEVYDPLWMWRWLPTWFPGSPYDASNVDSLTPPFFPGGTDYRAALNERDQGRFDKNRAKLLKQLEKLPADCVELLAQLGFKPAQLQQAVADQIPWDGRKSTISQLDAGVWQGPPRPTDSSQRTRAWDAESAMPVSDALRQSPGTAAVSQLNGPNAYYRGTNWFTGLFGTGSVSPENIFHETLHNLGKDDDQIQRAWGLPLKSEGHGSKNISERIKEKCF